MARLPHTRFPSPLWPGRSHSAQDEPRSPPSPRRGEGWGEGDRAIVEADPSLPPHPILAFGEDRPLPCGEREEPARPSYSTLDPAPYFVRRHPLPQHPPLLVSRSERKAG